MSSPEQTKGGGTPPNGYIPSQVSEAQYRKALKGIGTETEGKVVDTARKVNGHWKALPKNARIGALGAIGLAGGMIHSGTDRDDDTVVSVLTTSAVYGGGAYAATKGVDRMLDNLATIDTKKNLWHAQVERFEQQARAEQKKIDALVEKHGPERAEEIRKKRGLETFEEKTQNAKAGATGRLVNHEQRHVRDAKRLLKGGKLAVGAIAVGSVLSVGHGMKRKAEEAEMLREQEKNLKQQQKRKRETYRQQSYNDPTMGNLVLQMFEERTGHHKMGDARFY